MMTANPNPSSRLPATVDDALLLDRPAPQGRQSVRDIEDLRTVRDLDSLDNRPIILSPAPPARPTAADALSRSIGMLAKLTLLLILLAVLWGVVSFVNMGIRAPITVTDAINSALERGANAATSAAQRVTDTFDPAHPPRQAMVQDSEIDELLRLNVGAEIPGSSARTLTVASIQRQAAPTGQDAAIYAVLHGELRTPQDTKVLGMTVRSTRDPQDYYLYKGETVRIGQKLYRVNWVSMERQQVALVAYRDQDRVAAPLKAQID